MGNCCRKAQEEPDEIEVEPAPEPVEAEPEPEPEPEEPSEPEPEPSPEKEPEPEPPSDTEPLPVLEPEPVVSLPPQRMELPTGPFEIHSTDIMQHEITVCGIPLRETKKLTKINIDNNHPYKEIMIHTRNIGDKAIEVTNISTNGRVIDVIVDTSCGVGVNYLANSRTMSEEEIMQFRRDWGKLWIPVSDEEMEHKVRNAKEVIPLSPAYQQRIGASKLEGSRINGSRIGGSKMIGSRVNGSKIDHSKTSNMLTSGMPMK